jgi:hypothetical protein
MKLSSLDVYLIVAEVAYNVKLIYRQKVGVCSRSLVRDGNYCCVFVQSKTYIKEHRYDIICCQPL